MMYWINGYKKIIFLSITFLFIYAIFYIYKNRQPFMFLDVQYLNGNNIYLSSDKLCTKYNFHININLKPSIKKEVDKYMKDYLIRKDRDFYIDMKIVTRATKNLMFYGSKSNYDKFRTLGDLLDISGKYRKVFIDIMTNKLTERVKYNIDLYSKTKFFVLIDSTELFDFHNKFKDPLYILKYIFLDTKDEIRGLQNNKPLYQKLGNKEII